MDDVFFEPGRYVGDFEVELSEDVRMSSSVPAFFETSTSGCTVRCTFVSTPRGWTPRSARKLRVEVSREFDAPPDLDVEATAVQQRLPCATQAGFAVMCVLRAACEAFVERFVNLVRYTLAHAHLEERCTRVHLHQLWLFRESYCEPVSCGEGIPLLRKARGPQPLPLTASHLSALSDAAAGDEPPLSSRLLLDATFALNRGRLEEAVLHGATACELATKHCLLSAVSSDTSELIPTQSEWPVLDLLERDTARVFGASFAVEEPEAFAELRALFDCASSLVSGGPCRYRHGTGARDATLQDVERWLLAVSRACNWFEDRLARRDRDAPITAPLVVRRGRREAS